MSFSYDKQALGKQHLTDSTRQLLGCSDERYTQDQMNGGIYGHITWEDSPVSRKALFTDVIDMGYAAESTTIGNVMDTLAGPFCYLYV